jgi:hypothetical protein
VYQVSNNTQESFEPPALPQANARSWQNFADLIAGAWRKSAASFIEAAQYLLEAKQELGRDEYEALVQLKLPFDSSVARKLLRIADCPHVCAPGHIPKLPPSWTIIYDLTKADATVVKAALEDGRISPRMSRKDALALRGKISSSRPKPKVARVDGVAWWATADLDARRRFLLDVRLEDLIAAMPADMAAGLQRRALASLETKAKLSASQRAVLKALRRGLKAPTITINSDTTTVPESTCAAVA